MAYKTDDTGNIIEGSLVFPKLSAFANKLSESKSALGQITLLQSGLKSNQSSNPNNLSRHCFKTDFSKTLLKDLITSGGFSKTS